MNRYLLHIPRPPIEEYLHEFYAGQQWKRTKEYKVGYCTGPSIITLDRLYLSEIWFLKESKEPVTEMWIRDNYEPI